MRFSVVIPSYNRAAQLMLTLAAFEKMAYPLGQFELIVVNDGLTDDTDQRLRQYAPPYPLQLVSLSRQTGRAVARNVGVSAARGDILVFCDPDFVVLPQFLSMHDQYQSQAENAVVSGIPHSWGRVYPHFHADFTEEEKHVARASLQQSGLWQDGYWHARSTVEIVTPDDIRHGTGQLERVVASWDLPQPIKAQFASTDVAPWMLAVTRCLSMPRRLFRQAGGFFDKFQQHGLEDWELGYRLHRLGCRFASIAQTIGYHQEHPGSYRNGESATVNLDLLYENNGCSDPELSLLAVYPPSKDIRVYKNVLRILQAWATGDNPLYRSAAAHVRATCERGARLCIDNPASPAYLQLLEAVQPAFKAASDLYELHGTGELPEIRRILGEACGAGPLPDQPPPGTVALPVRKRARKRPAFMRRHARRRRLARKRPAFTRRHAMRRRRLGKRRPALRKRAAASRSRIKRSG
ncbi:glycosyltransferase family 2 protein [Paenibacillus cymbidii]|uniref:glycosyltransferase family 2 protein n=1 Tax=Paenibacillus cymbidii TaxID=1639034 RepID=UPI001081B6EA|nr:glycosyltransferase family 2 protein [Paenibacillus cymbidii]